MRMMEVLRRHADGNYGYHDTMIWDGHSPEELRQHLISEGWSKDIRVRYVPTGVKKGARREKGRNH